MAIAASLALTACNEREPAALVAENVREARGEAEENLSKARRQAGDVMAETGPQLGSADADVRGAALEDRAEANYDVALVEAAGAREVALERCDGLSATAQFDCKQRVEREYDAAKAAARAELAVQRERAEQIAERDDLY
ncbi:MAG TPA: hypothetical protein P5528_11210 [Steroidobacteraceae bacterium]|nr:hypothetical protein [Steroidobacteraceae bacterium]HRX89999.1 hypothetical protein [Steroidobacteraceae bacterium]